MSRHRRGPRLRWLGLVLLVIGALFSGNAVAYAQAGTQVPVPGATATATATKDCPTTTVLVGQTVQCTITLAGGPNDYVPNDVVVSGSGATVTGKDCLPPPDVPGATCAIIVRTPSSLTASCTYFSQGEQPFCVVGRGSYTLTETLTCTAPGPVTETIGSGGATPVPVAPAGGLTCAPPCNKPGYGSGDQNHAHCGPPGKSTKP